MSDHRKGAEYPYNRPASHIVTYTVLLGSLGVAVLLTLLLAGYDLLVMQLRVRTVIGLVVIGYLLLGYYLVLRSRVKAANWMIIILYELLVLGMLLNWGINTAAGILAACFVIILPGLLLGARYIFPVTFSAIAILLVVQTLHTLQIIHPNLQVLSDQASYWDVLVYATMLIIFALVSWLAQKQTERSLKRAHQAEETLRIQKEHVAAELRQESATLRQARLSHTRQLYQFALMGQSSAATLHELSNQLSILNLDIDDLGQQHKNSEAIKNARDTIAHLNSTVRQSRRQLQNCAIDEAFTVMSVVRSALADIAPKYTQRQVKLVQDLTIADARTTTLGSPTALMQIMTILLNNALDACQDLENPWVKISVQAVGKTTEVWVIDSGPGIDDLKRPALFTPTPSSKPTGLGIGLYIAKQLAKTQLHGSLRLEPSSLDRGAHFVIAVPHKKERSLTTKSKKGQNPIA